MMQPVATRLAALVIRAFLEGSWFVEERYDN